MENDLISDQNSTSICSLCQMTFPSYEEILVHTCVEIKEDKIEEIIEHSEIIANEQFFDPEDFKDKSSFSCLDLSEEFLISILKQVDDLCENIKCGDPDIERTIKVNQNLNNAVTFYRSELDLKKHISIDTDYNNADITVECNDGIEEECVPTEPEALKENPNKLKSQIRKSKRAGNIKAVYDEKENPKKFKCITCNFSTENKGTLKKHIEAVHEGIKSFKCDICDYECALKGNLKHHIASVHQGIKPFKCKLCDYEFSKHSSLKRHIESVHERIKSFNCKLCDFKTATKCSLKEHIESVHERIKSFNCNICGFKTTIKHSLKEHMKSVHEGPKLKLKSERPTKEFYDEKLKVVKNQCGRHSTLSMAGLLNMPLRRLQQRIKKENIIFQKKPIEYSSECQFCEMEKNSAEVVQDDLLPLLRFNQDEEKFQCFFCNSLFSGSKWGKQKLVVHLKLIHRNEINAKSIMNTKSERNQDCDGSVCIKIYPSFKKFWCQKCTKELQESIGGVCPECGLIVDNLAKHCRKKHGEKQVCSLCSREFKSLSLLQGHKRSVHERVPCSECGKLVGVRNVKRHMESAHTPDDQKKFRCEICGKGFSERRGFSDHMNVHTGEKPYKCKFCSSCFANYGNLAEHERIHKDRVRKDCPNCNKSFASQDSLGCHLRKSCKTKINKLNL